MRVAMLGPFGFHPNKTMRSRAFRLARPLVGRGHAVKIIMPPWHTPGEAGKSWREDGVEIENIALSGGTLGITRRLIATADAFQPDVVHCFKPKAYSGLAAWGMWQRRWWLGQSRPRLIVDTDDWEGWGGWNDLADYSPLQKQFFARQEQWGMRHCDVLTAASRALETLALGHGVPPQKVCYLPNGPGIEVKANGRNDALRQKLGLAARPTLLLYSRLFELDIAHLVAVLRGVQAQIPDLAILAVGASLFGEDAAELRQQLEAAGLLPAFIDAGWVEEAKVAETLQAADVGLYLMRDTLLNRTKCPVKLADMAAVGLPVVGEAVGQVREYVVQGETGLLRPSGEAAGLIEDAVKLLRNPFLRQQMGENAAAHITAHFGWERRAADLERVYTP